MTTKFDGRIAPTIVDLLRVRAGERPDFRGYVFLPDGETAQDGRTWGELDRRARAIGARLRAMGAMGANVLMLYPPGLGFTEGYFGCLYAGAVPVPAYPPEPARLSRTLPRVQSIVADAGARFALTTKPLLAIAEMVFAQAPDLARLEWLATDTVDGALADDWVRPEIGSDSLALIQYTSGSTGTPKGVMLSHANLLYNSACIQRVFDLDPEDRYLSWLPTFHDMGFMVGVLQPLCAGIQSIGMPPTAFLERPYRWLAAIHATRATISGGPNFAYDLCVRKTTPEQRAVLDLSCWHVAFNGAEPVRLETIDRFANTFADAGFERRAVFPCFGLAEATLMVSGGGRIEDPIAHRFDKAALEAGVIRDASDGDAAGYTAVACGATAFAQEIAIVDPETSRRVGPDRVGEIWVTGPSVGQGYWARPEDSEATFRARIADDGDHAYLRTGDLGFMRDGQLYIGGRAKDLIVVRGSNHYPQDLELTIERAHQAIRPGCVAAFSIDVDGEERIAVVAEIDRRYHSRDRRKGDRGRPDRRAEEAPGTPSTTEEPLDADQLFWVIRDAIVDAHELQPHAIVLIRAGSIHKTSSGKIQRRACKRAFAAGELEVLAEWRADGTRRTTDVASAAPRPARPADPPARPADPPADGPVRSEAAPPAAAPALRPPARSGEIPTVAAGAPPSADPPRPLTETAALRKPSVLVVDAELANLEFMVRTLRERFVVAAVDAADKALQLAAVSTFAAVIATHNLPGMSGAALLARIAEITPHTARLIVTRFDDAEALRDAVNRAHVTGVLSQPVGPKQLLGAVSEAVDAWVTHHTELAVSAIEGWLVSWLSRQLQVNPRTIDLDAPVSRHGLDSLSAVELQTALADWLGRTVPDGLMRGKASIRSIAHRLASVSDLGDRVGLAATPDRDTDAALAIVGMGCTVPGARGVEALWDLMRAGGDAISEVPDDRWDRAGYFDADPGAPGKMNTRWGGFVDGVANFDAACFGMAPRDAARVDPQHRLLLETTWQALEDAAIAPDELAGSNAGVFVGISGSDFLRSHPELSITDVGSAAAHRLSYFFNLKGPSVAIDSGDVSSLAALHLAAASLQRGECKLAIVAGVNLVLAPHTNIAYAKARLLASDGRCKPLDTRADGSVLSDGCGVVVLKRLADARTGANRIRGQILATALLQSGRGHGITAPNEAAQELVIREALRRANTPPTDVQYVELNARGLPDFDAIEVRALAAVVAPGRPPERTCVLGSLKANIGDTCAASGVLGVIKAALVLAHDEIPRLVHLRDVHPQITLGFGLRAPTETTPWPANFDRRIACVNNFGLLGTNGVAVVGAEPRAPSPAVAELPAYVLCVSARHELSLRELAGRYAAHLATTPPDQLANVCFTANVGRAHFAQRAAITATSPAAMRDQLLAIARGDRPTARVIGRGTARVAFLFTGRGAAGPEMARQLYTAEPRFRAILQRCDRAVREVLRRPLVAALYAMTGDPGDGWDAILEDPATVAVEYALADLWQSWGIHPDVVMGHDIGEYAAAAVAGALSVEDAVVLACERAQRLRDLGTPAAAATIVAPEAKVVAAISELGQPVAIAERNGPRRFDVVGTPAAVQALLAWLAGAGVAATARDRASLLHTPLVEPVLEGLSSAAHRLLLRAPSIPLVSNVTGKRHTDPLDAAYWRRHTSECVQFDRGLRELIRDGVDVFLEIGPRPTLTQLASEAMELGKGVWLASLDPAGSGDWAQMLSSLGALYERGVAPDWIAFDRGRERRRVGLPRYPFDRKRCWPGS